ncbi:hypothetical protein [Dyadobacter fermentans]|uniref:Uncharacterized protein n=1 Tax=Dyadobacter fermentans (strain ATCC 700827 / DSM 18053 / CIP 107007 / KCTC 52180 / NS114) TaxID=471854 RepID=C6VVE6_DYAFD|nr:hypothetical protein [Dyadobacter fermentans]ACT96676.1 hypothetical protein Dfer_5485 [Dyadobacter fermentans DSM 18053]
MTSTLLEDLELIESNLSIIPDTKKYWLVRTQSGNLYNPFKNNGLISIEHGYFAKRSLEEIWSNTPSEEKFLRRAVKELLTRRFDLDSVGLIAGQISRFAFEVKKDDIVIIPSSGTDEVTIGVVKSDLIETPELAQRVFQEATDVPSGINSNYRLSRKVRWMREIRKRHIDPYMYKMLQAHQAISNVTAYGDIIERSVKSFFARDNEASVVLSVEQEGEISAKDLFALGHYLMQSVDGIITAYDLPFTTDHVDIKINLNSPGRIQLTSRNIKLALLVAVVVASFGIVLFGGGLKIKFQDFDLDLSTDGAVQKIIDYKNNAQDREIKDRLVRSLDSLKVMPPEDALQLLKQFSTNKDNPK